MNTNKHNLLIVTMMFFVGFFLCGNGCNISEEDQSSKSDGERNSRTSQETPAPAGEQKVTIAEPEPTKAGTVEQKSPLAQEKPVKVEPKPTRIEWVRSVSEGLALAKEKGKPAFIDFYADWCPPCQQMDKVTFRDKQVIEELARFITIKADLTNSNSKGQSAAEEYGVQAIPTYVFIDTQGKKTIQVGYRPPDRFLRILQNIK